MSHPIHVGTSGWSYGDWAGPFYPPGTSKGDYLAAYAERFDVVEVDSTYYRPPTECMVQAWANRTPAGFRFALKVPSVVTHEKVLEDCEEEMEGLIGALEPLRAKIICVLLQFGYFNRQKFASAKPFMARLDKFLQRFGGDVPLAVEIRNKNWLSKSYFGLLRGHDVPAALVEHAWMPPIDQLTAQYDVVTGPFSYVRLIGDRQAIEKVTKTWEQEVLDRADDLKRAAQTIKHIAARTPVVVFVNNHYAGHGPATCARLVRELD